MASNYNNKYECYGNDLTRNKNYLTKKAILEYEVPLQDPFKMATSSRKTKTHTFVDNIDFSKNLQPNVGTLKMYGQKLHSSRTNEDSIEYIYNIKSQMPKNSTERKNQPNYRNAKNTSSPLVHQFTTNKFPISINNNNDNNNYVRRSYQKTRRSTFAKDEFDGYEDNETGQLMRAQSPNSNRQGPLVEDHYNRYFFYEYNRQFSPQPSRNKTSRKLPSLLMATYANKAFLEDSSKIIRKDNEISQRNIRKKREAKMYEHKNYEVLDNQNCIDIHGFKDKISNNNNNNIKNSVKQFAPDIEVIKGCGDCLDHDVIGENGNTILKKELSSKQAVSKKSNCPTYLPVQSRSSTYSLACQENNANSLHISEKDEKISNHGQFPTSGGSKKTKGPRVLLYNTNSPRLQGKPSSNHISGKSPSQHRFTETRRSLAMSPVRLNRIHIKQQIKPNTDNKTQPENTHNGVVLANTFNNNHSDDSNSDYDDIDDDFNNVSDLIASDDSESSSDAEEGYRAHTFRMIHPSDRNSSTQSYLSPQTSEESIRNPISLLVPSLFPNVPPYLSFSSNNQKGPEVPPELHRILKWRVSNVMPKVVRCVLSNSGMRLVKKTNEWMGVWGKHLKSPCFKAIRPYQKINHLPGSFKIGRKDSCWKNLKKNMGKHSKRDFGFMPRTYIIPSDLHNLRKHWPKYAQKNVKWIIKPPASARGAGIRVINRWAQIPKRKPIIVQRYIERPLLINGSKFDLRLYVLVTSINPLRVFLYHNGLARFASVKYSDKAETLNDRCMHLTNYSINKFSSNYSKNEDVNACHGHKWTLKSLWTYLANRGVRTDSLWEAMRNLVLRTVLAGESTMNNMIKYNVESKYSCYELFGFDVILDSELIPWLLEVNISPSLHSDLPLDAHVKAPLVQSVLNTALYNIPPKLTYEKQKEIAAQMNYSHTGSICYDKRLYVRYLSRAEKLKHETFTRKGMEDRDEYIHTILEHLTPDDVRCLIIAEDELARCAPLERIFPTNQTYKYLKCTENPRYYNRLLDAWEARYSKNRAAGIDVLRKYCEVKYHLQVPPPPAKKDSNVEGSQHGQLANKTSEKDHSAKND